MLIVIVILY